MKLRSYYATLGLVAVSVVAVAGCTVNSTSTGADDAAADNTDTSTGTPEDSGTTDTGTTTPEDAGTTTVTDASDASAATCSVTPATGTAACDTCLEGMCCPQLEACYGTDSGAGSCVALLSCLQDCEAGNPDAGVAADTLSDCLSNVCAADGGTTYTAADQTNAIALLACLGDGDAGANLCGSSCGQ